MRVIVYVEGPSDKLGMEALLRPLVDASRQRGVDIQFFESPKGDRKVSVLTRVPIRAANIVLNDPQSVVVALPDLYPRNKGFQHETAEELMEGITQNFRRALKAKGAESNPELAGRFRAFCFKFDVEVLLLASEEGLRQRLGVASLKPRWRIPVEDQNHDRPPARIVEELFEESARRYVNTLDVPWILGRSDYRGIAQRCPQCFRPFVAFLESISADQRHY